MRVYPVKSEKDWKDFISIEKVVYAKNSAYIPYLHKDIKNTFSQKTNKLYALGGKSALWIIRNEQQQGIGRIAAFINPKTAFKNKQKTGGIGFFECIDHEEAAKILFDTAREWLQNQGMEAMDGPVNFGERERFWGLMVNRFNEPASYGMYYHPPYYRKFFENYGFQIWFEQYVFRRDLNVPAQQIFIEKSENLRKDPLFKLSNAQWMSKTEIIDCFLTVYNDSWAGLVDFKPMQRAQANAIISSLYAIIDKRIVIFAFYNGRPVGFYINIPELNEFFVHLNGNFNWWAKLKFLWYFKTQKRKRMVGIIFGVVKDFQGKGVDGAMIKFAEEHIAQKNHYQDTILAWIGDFNRPMLKIAEHLGAEKYRTYITYRYLFDRALPFERHPFYGK